MTSRLTYCIAVIALTAVTVLFFGYLEAKKTYKNNSYSLKLKEMLIDGVSKLISTIGVALLSAGVIAVILSLFIKPTPENVMPAYASGTSYYNWETIDVSWTETIICESESRTTTNPETAYAFMDNQIPSRENAFLFREG